jgi:DNA-binding beta-propeller fold protein YncE
MVSVLAGSSQGFQDTSTLFFWKTPKFYNPKGLAIDSGGNLYIADTWNNRIRKIVK